MGCEMFPFSKFLGHRGVKVIRGLRLPKSRNPRIFVMYGEQGWNPKLQSGKPSEISRDTVFFPAMRACLLLSCLIYRWVFPSEDERHLFIVPYPITCIQQTTTKRNQHTFGQHVEFMMFVAISFLYHCGQLSKNIPSGVDGRSQGLWCCVWSSVHGQRHHVAGDQRCPGDGKCSNTWDNLCRWCWWLSLIIAKLLFLSPLVVGIGVGGAAAAGAAAAVVIGSDYSCHSWLRWCPAAFWCATFVFNTQQTQVQGKQQLQVFMWFLQSFNTIYLISEGWPHNPTDSHGTIWPLRKGLQWSSMGLGGGCNGLQTKWLVDHCGYGKAVASQQHTPSVKRWKTDPWTFHHVLFRAGSVVMFWISVIHWEGYRLWRWWRHLSLNCLYSETGWDMYRFLQRPIHHLGRHLS